MLAENDMVVVCGRHVEMGEQPGEQGIGVLVVDHEPGVDRDLAAGRGHHDGVAVPADARIRLEHGDGMSATEQPSRGKSGDAGADNSDPHS